MKYEKVHETIHQFLMRPSKPTKLTILTRAEALGHWQQGWLLMISLHTRLDFWSSGDVQ